MGQFVRQKEKLARDAEATMKFLQEKQQQGESSKFKTKGKKK
jgi:hypothetical protein